MYLKIAVLILGSVIAPHLALADVVDDLARHFCKKATFNWADSVDKGFSDEKFASSAEKVIKQYDDRYGNCISFKRTSKGIKLNYKEAFVDIRVVTSGGKISGIWFEGERFKNDSFEKIGEELKKLEGSTSLMVKRGDETIYKFNADKPLATGSSFKLFVLRALKDKVDSGSIAWSDVVSLRERDISYPSGILHTWIPDTPMTVKSLASLMISESDNTATDMLINLLGRQLLESYMPHSKPFLRTKEVFVLKHALNNKKRNQYLNADYNYKVKVLDDIALKNATYIDLGNHKPCYIDSIEWFATTEELCSVIYSMKEEKLLTINPGVINNRRKWKFIGYKGGYEPGVRQLTQLLQSKNGRWYCISATWNDTQKELDDAILDGLVNRVAHLLF